MPAEFETPGLGASGTMNILFTVANRFILAEKMQ